jgi:hypothetical protein
VAAARHTSAEWYLFGGGCNVLVVTTFRTGLLLFPFAFHSYYKDLVSTAAFTLNIAHWRGSEQGGPDMSEGMRQGGLD